MTRLTDLVTGEVQELPKRESKTAEETPRITPLPKKKLTDYTSEYEMYDRIEELEAEVEMLRSKMRRIKRIVGSDPWLSV